MAVALLKDQYDELGTVCNAQRETRYFFSVCRFNNGIHKRGEPSWYLLIDHIEKNSGCLATPFPTLAALRAQAWLEV